MTDPIVVHTIDAQLHHPQAAAAWRECYCFDNEEMGLVAEPFVESATEAIEILCSCLLGETCKPERVRLHVCADDVMPLMQDPLQGVLAELQLVGPKDDGHDYHLSHVIEPDTAAFGYAHGYDLHTLWLCPVLTQYFGGAPRFLYVEVIPQI